MADAPDSLAPVSANPIFADLDIPCPHCEYNLRGLIEPRCPECGNPFDPHKVLHDFRETQPPLPIRWVIRNVYHNPLGFWQLNQVRRSQGPRRMQLFFALLFLPLVVGGCLMLLSYSFLRPVRPLHIFYAVSGGLTEAAFTSLFLYMLVLIHGILCRIGLARSAAREGVRAAKEVVGYGLVWFTPMLLGTLVVARYGGTLFVAGASAWAKLIAVAAICLMIASCVAWAITLYQGAKFVSGGSRAVAAWCTLANPFWYVLALAAIMALG